MSGTYRAWNGKTYRWPPPDGWYRAADGRWWAPGSGPNPPSDPRLPIDHPSPSSMVRQRPRPPRPAVQSIDRTGTEADPAAEQADAVGSRPSPRPNRRASRLAAIAAGVVLAAMTGGAIVGLLAATFGGGSGSRIDAVAASTTSTTASGSAGSGSPTDSGGGPSTTGRPGVSTTASSSTTAASEPDQGTATSTQASESGATTSEPGPTGDRAGRITRFRQLVTADDLGSNQLTDQDVQDLAEALCVIAMVEDTTGFLAARSQIAADQAVGSTLTAEQLSGTIDAAVRAFCSDDATRLGL